MDFPKVLKSVAGFFESEGLKYAAIGAFGLHAYGLTRATSDLDFVVESRAQDRLVPFLEGLGYETLHRSSGYSNHLHPDSTMGRLDFVYVSGETTRQIFESAEKKLVLGDIAVAVPRPEHLAAMKIHAMKNDPQRTFQEMADILFLLRLPQIDEQEVKAYFEKEGLLERFNELKNILDASQPGS